MPDENRRTLRDAADALGSGPPLTERELDDLARQFPGVDAIRNGLARRGKVGAVPSRDSDPRVLRVRRVPAVPETK